MAMSASAWPKIYSAGISGLVYVWYRIRLGHTSKVHVCRAFVTSTEDNLRVPIQQARHLWTTAHQQEPHSPNHR
jgi:hypothetical protein